MREERGAAPARISTGAREQRLASHCGTQVDHFIEMPDNAPPTYIDLTQEVRYNHCGMKYGGIR